MLKITARVTDLKGTQQLDSSLLSCQTRPWKAARKVKPSVLSPEEQRFLPTDERPGTAVPGHGNIGREELL